MGGRVNIYWSYGLENVCGKSAVGNYPGGEPLITHFPRNGPRLDKILMRPMSMLDLMAGLFFADALAERGQRDPPELILPFVPGARQDRLSADGVKNSARGRLAVVYGDDGKLRLIEKATPDDEAKSLLEVVWRNGKSFRSETFDVIRERARLALR
jgi:hypothetical protein